MYVENLKKAAHLLLWMEINMICHVIDFVKEVCNNPTEISISEEYDYLSVNINMQDIDAVDNSNVKLENTIKSSVTAQLQNF